MNEMMILVLSALVFLPAMPVAGQQDGGLVKVVPEETDEILAQNPTGIRGCCPLGFSPATRQSLHRRGRLEGYAALLRPSPGYWAL